MQVNQANINRGINNIHISLNISKLKQQIASLQNQIAQQQAAYVNKQPGGNHNMGGNGEFNLYEKKNKNKIKNSCLRLCEIFTILILFKAKNSLSNNVKMVGNAYSHIGQSNNMLIYDIII